MRESEIKDDLNRVYFIYHFTSKGLIAVCLLEKDRDIFQFSQHFYYLMYAS